MKEKQDITDGIGKWNGNTIKEFARMEPLDFNLLPCFDGAMNLAKFHWNNPLNFRCARLEIERLAVVGLVRRVFDHHSWCAQFWKGGLFPSALPLCSHYHLADTGVHSRRRGRRDPILHQATVLRIAQSKGK